MNDQKHSANVQLSDYDLEVILAAIDEQIFNVMEMDVSSEEWRASYILSLRDVERRLVAYQLALCIPF